MKESLTSYIRLKELIIESLSTSPTKKDCNCGCEECVNKQKQKL